MLSAALAISFPTLGQDAPDTRPNRGKAPIERRLLAQVDALGEAPFWVMLKDQADLTPGRNIRNWSARGNFVHSNLVAAANRSQPRIRSLLQSRGARPRSYWALNAILTTGNRRLIEELAAQPEVKGIIAERVYSVPPVITAVPRTNVNGVEWNIDRINAPVAWNNYGTRGEGIVVCNIDTGVQFDHPALVNSYRGNVGGSFSHDYNWFDPSTNSFAPFDDNGHGTHTMGTMVGDGGEGNRIGVAPGARWIAAKGCSGGSCSGESLLAAAQWVLAPTDLNGANPNPAMRPNIVNNSWGGDMVMDTWFQDIVRQWIAAGIYPVFSVGNLGSSCWTAASPGDYPEAYSVGAFDISDHLAAFSSGGPTYFGGIKPDITAPGVDVRSAYLNSGYAFISGTSMAAPHVAGAVALLWSAAPALKGDVAATRALLDAAAINVPDSRCGGSITNNNMWGHGKLDASILLSLAPLGPTGSLEGGITNAISGLPIPGAQVTASGPMNRTTFTDTNGQYVFATLAAGTYDVQAVAYGFDSQVSPAVGIAPGSVSTQHFALQPTVASFSFSGTVMDGSGTAISNAVITILGTTNSSAVTAGDGSFGFTNIPQGTYLVLAEPNCCFETVTRELVLAGDTTGFDFVVTQRSDAFGYRCQVVSPGYIEASTPISLAGNDFYKQVSLPFPFLFYGKPYTNVFVSCNGFVSFVEDSVYAYWNAGIPDEFAPNAGIYCFWDDLFVDLTNTVRTATTGSAPNRQFIIEWRDVYLQDYAGLMDIELVLRENGEIVMQYRDVSPSAPYRGAFATIGIENEEGRVAFPFSVNRPTITSSNFAISFTMPPAAFVQGHVTDQNDGQAIRRATIRVHQQGKQFEVTTDDQGFYRTQALLGTPLVEALANNYEPASAPVSLSEAGATVVQDFVLVTGKAEVNPAALNFTLGAGGTQSLTLTITNSGTRDLNWSLNPSGGFQVSSQSQPTRNPHAPVDSPTTKGLYKDGMVQNWPALEGEILKVWTPTNVALPWGVLFHTNVWLSDGESTSTNKPDIFEFTPEGMGTGVSRDTSTNGAWVADMTYDSTHGLVCQVNVGGTGGLPNCISCWDPSTGLVVTNITGTWTNYSQRGIAYRPDNDTFYIGNWFTYPGTGLIRQIKGLSWDVPGQILAEWMPLDPNIAGLAWNPVQKVLWQASNGFHDLIYALDPATGLILATLQHPDPGYNGAGLECDSNGNLWMVSQGGRTAYLLNSGITTFTNVPWISYDVSSGVLAPGQSQVVQVQVDATSLVPGNYSANLILSSDAGHWSATSVPVIASVVPQETFVTSYTLGTPRRDSPLFVGMRITIGQNPLTVTGLGRMMAPGNSLTHTLKIVQASDGLDLPGGTTSINMAGGVEGHFKYASLPAPVVLTPGASYYIVSKEEVGGDWWYDYNSTVSTSRVAYVNSAVYGSGPGWVMVGSAGRCYVPLDFLHEPVTVHSLRVGSVNPSSGVTIGISPADKSGQQGGLTEFVRSYDAGTVVSLSAPAEAAGNTFRNWQRDGVDYDSNRLTAVSIDNDYSMTAVFESQETSFTRTVTPGTLRNDSGLFVGLKFTVGNLPARITSLGRIMVAGNTGSHLVKLVDAATGLDVPGGSVTVAMAGGTAGEFRYAVLSDPVTLEAGTSYYLVSKEFYAGDYWYDWNTRVTTTPVATVDSAVYGNAGTWYTPSGTGRAYVPVDFRYATRSLRVTCTNSEETVTELTPADDLGLAKGTNTFNATYRLGETVTVSAPRVTGTNIFKEWLQDGVFFSTNTSAEVTLTNDCLLQPVYGPPEVPFVTSATFGTIRNDSPLFVGMRFQVGSEPLTILSLGRIKVDGNTQVHTVKLVYASTGADVPGGAVDISTSGGAAGSFLYSALPAPLTFPAGEVLLLVSKEHYGGDTWYDWNTAITTSPGATNLSAAYGSGPGAWFYPARAGRSYVPVNFLYAGKTERTLSIRSTLPNSGVPISVTPPDKTGQGDGATPFTRTYSYGETVALSAPATIGSSTFAVWRKDGVDWSTSRDTEVVVDSDATLTAVYTAPTTALVTNVVTGPLRNNSGLFVGARIVIGPNPLLVTALGRFKAPGNTGQHQVKLVNASDGIDLPGGSVVVSMEPATVGQFAYADLPEPVLLTAGATYYLVSRETYGGDYWYDYTTRLATTADAVVSSAVYGDGWWYSPGGTGNAYVPVDLRYVAQTPP